MDYWQLLANPERFLLFTLDVYRSMLGAYNQDSLPLIVGASGAGILLTALLMRRRAIPAIPVYAVLAGLWLWLGIVFHGEQYASINWAAERFAVAAVLQGALFGLYAVWKARGRRLTCTVRCGGLGIAWLVLALTFPIVEIAAGVAPAEARFAALTPDTLAWTTLALVLLTDRRPWLWCLPAAGLAIIDAATATLLGDAAAVTVWVIFGATLLALPWCARSR